jgi:hypothetical protein
MKRVSKEEYEKVLEANKDRIFCHVSGICEPPAVNHYDKETGELIAHTFYGADEYYVKE